MLIIPAGVKIHMALGHTDMRNYAERTIMLSPGPLAEYPRCSAIS
jgi:hypothetical protein